MYGTEPVAIPMPIPRMDAPAAESRLKEIISIREEALAAHEINRRKMATRVKPKGYLIKKGDKVWLSTKNLKIPNTSKKLSPRRTGPFEVTETKGPVTFKLKLPAQWRIHDTFHRSHLSPFKETDVHGPNYTDPPPDILNGEEEWEVESILSHRGTGTRRRFLIKWKGYGDNNNTWEPEENLKHARTMLKQYKKRHKL